MDLLVLAAPIMAMGGLLALMQRVESRMTARVRVPNQPAGAAVAAVESRAQLVRSHRASRSPLVAATPFGVVVTLAVLVGGAAIRMAS